MAHAADTSTWMQLKRLLGHSFKTPQNTSTTRDFGDLNNKQSMEENNKTSSVVPFYVGLSAVVWGVFFTIRHTVHDEVEDAWPLNFIATAILATVCSLLYIVKRTRSDGNDSDRRCLCYHREPTTKGNVPLPRLSKIWAAALTMAFASVAVLLSSSSSASFVSDSVKFAWTMQLVIILYTCIPKLSNTTKSDLFWVCSACAVILSIVFEVLTTVTFCLERNWSTDSKTAVLGRVVGRILLHVGVHFIGLGVGLQSISRSKTVSLSGDEVEAERQVSRHCRQTALNIVQLLMPIDVARDVVQNCLATRRRINENPLGWFVMNRVDNVSILFADIVGFSVISQRLSPDRLVHLLNDLYQRFDAVCCQRDIEPIGTLGDCYYCVAGYPGPRQSRDHASRAVDAGLAMCREIVEFRQANGNCAIDMRIGIHSGSANCGVFGRRRMRFDVFSNDVIIANKMESTGRRGRVHVSNETYELVRSKYYAEQGDDYTADKNHMISTWYILDRIPGSNNEAICCPQNGAAETIQNRETCTSCNSKSSLEDLYGQLYADSVNNVKHVVDSGSDRRCFDRTLLNDMVTFCLFIHIVVVANLIGSRCASTGSSSRPPWPEISLVFGASLATWCLSLLVYLLTFKLRPWQLIWTLGRATRYLMISLSVAIVSMPSTAVLLYAVSVCDIDVDWLFASIVVALIHHGCSTTVLSATLKSALALAVGIASIIVLGCGCRSDVIDSMTLSYANTVKTTRVDVAESRFVLDPVVAGQRDVWQVVEFSLIVITVVILVFIVNRQMETEYRMWLEAEINRIECECTSRQADMLLRRVVPRQVADELLRTGGQLPVSYRRSFPCAGVLFANITFDYDEDFAHGVERLRPLNTIFCMYEELLERPEYANSVEKIKTIGSCMMVASGIHDDDSEMYSDEDYLDHLDILVRFAFDLNRTLQEYNESVKVYHITHTITIGVNCGPVTVGVIGTSWTMFDIWGSTVNFASRMYSTGEVGKIQMSTDCHQRLGDRYDFERRDGVPVRGFNVITTYLIRL